MARAGILLSFDGVLHRSGIERMPAAGSRKPGPEHFEWVYDFLALIAGHPEIELAVLSRWRLLHDARELRALIPQHLASRICAVASTDLPKPLASMELASLRGWSCWVALESEAGAFGANHPRLVLCDPKLGVNDPAVRARLLAWLDALRSPA